MSAGTHIEWTDASWPVIRGCTKVSPGCDNCWAIRDAHLHGGGSSRIPSEDEVDAAEPEAWGRLNGRRKAAAHFAGLTKITNGRPNWTGAVRVDQSILSWPFKWSEPRRIFVASSGDLFHESLTDGDLAKVFGAMIVAPQHTYQLLTKRAERIQEYFRSCRFVPPANWWLGVSVENQATADERIPWLLKTPAAVRWVSYEPALGPVDFQGHGRAWLQSWTDNKDWSALDWIVVGGESGPCARPFDLAWARNTIAQCRAAGVPCFVKQIGTRPFEQTEAAEFQWKPKDRKGGDMSEWPEDLRVREYPR